MTLTKELAKTLIKMPNYSYSKYVINNPKRIKKDRIKAIKLFYDSINPKK
jgi:hypothetical protein